MNLTKEEIEDIFIDLCREKGEDFLETLHQERMNKFKVEHPEHYATMTQDELLEAKNKEKEIVDKYFMETYEYPYTIGKTGRKCTGDGIPQSTMKIIENYFVEFFYEPLDTMEVKNTPEILDLKNVADVVYEMTALIVEHVKRAGNYQDFYIDNKIFSDNKSRAKPTIQNKAKELLEILDEYAIGCPKSDTLYESLQNLYNNVDRYLLPEYGLLTASLKEQYLQPLKQYLNELLPRKKTLINNFTKELIKDIQKAYSAKTNKMK